MSDSLSKSTSLLGWDMISNILAQSPSLTPTTVSPLSVSFALGMLAGGADADVREKLCSKLGIENAESLNTIYSNLVQTFSQDTNAKTLSIANAVFADQSFSINPNFVEHLKSFRAYHRADFRTLPEGTDDINNWITENTNQMIKNMLTPSSLENSHVALVNALAFKGTWLNKFDPKQTRKGFPFRVSSDTTRPTDMMFLQSPTVLVGYGNGFEAIRLPYAASSTSLQMSFIAYLPKTDKSVQDILLEIRDQDIPSFSKTMLGELGFPKLDFKTAFDVFDMLKELGYPLSGNFPKMGDGPNVVGAILHNAVIKLDEHGTEAAAATVVVMRRSRPVAPPPSLIFDRPFAFSIVIDATNLVVFTGVFTVD